MELPALRNFSAVLEEENPDLFKWLTGQEEPSQHMAQNTAFQVCAWACAGTLCRYGHGTGCHTHTVVFPLVHLGCLLLGLRQRHPGWPDTPVALPTRITGRSVAPPGDSLELQAWLGLPLAAAPGVRAVSEVALCV